MLKNQKITSLAAHFVQSRLMALALLVCMQGTACAQAPAAPPTGMWNAWLESPGGRLPFQLRVEPTATGLRAAVHLGEKIPIPNVVWNDNELLLEFVHYDSRIRARWDRQRDRLHGEWERRSGPDLWSRLPFAAERQVQASTQPDGEAMKSASKIAGRWHVEFSDSDDPAVGIFEETQSGRVHGTFLTTTGDYRYLEGRYENGAMRVAAFDGAHAFLFVAAPQEDGTLRGDFWSRDTWHETWTARRDPNASLPDAMQLTKLHDEVALADFSFPAPDGTLHSLTDPAFAGKARIIELFGTWCPNCYDATRYLIELQERYGDRGLAILALAFEITGDFPRDAAQVQRYVEHHGIAYPILVAGTSDKKEASRAFPLIDRVRAYPTMLFVDTAGTVKAIYTGFSGPATGPAHDHLREQIESLVEELLSES